MKVKNLYWDEIQPTEDEPELIKPVPSWEDVKQAINESYEAHERWFADKTHENWAAYQSANNRAASLNADRLHAILMESEIWSL
jgi:hypothetical protein